MNETSQLPLLACVDAQLSALCIFTGKDIASTMRQILHQVCRDETVFPTLQFDGGGELSASWHVEGSSLWVIVGQDGEVTAHCTWRRPYTVWHLPDNLQEVRDCLYDLSSYVQRHNANWQELFAS